MLEYGTKGISSRERSKQKGTLKVILSRAEHLRPIKAPWYLA
jgi:hypothetical protein